MKTLASMLLIAAATGLPACERMDIDWTGRGGRSAEPPSPTPTPPTPTTPDPTSRPASHTPPKRVKLMVSVRMATIEVPAGTVSSSEEVWSYLDEESVTARRSISLGRNGIRVGLGRRNAWPDLADVLKRMTGHVPKQSTIAATPNDPFQIILKEKQPEATIFSFRDDRTLSGRDYPRGDYMLALSFTLDEDDATRVMLSAVPQVCSTKRVTKFVHSPMGPQMISEPEVFSLDDLTFRLMVPPKGFLVIGPGANARNASTVGHHFLTRQREGVEYETVLVLTPEVIAAPIP